MMRAFTYFLAAISLWLGCSRQPAAVKPTPTAPYTLTSTLEIKPAFAGSPSAVAPGEPRAFEIIIMTLHEEHLQEHGLSNFFSSTQPAKSLVTREIERSSLTALARTASNATVSVVSTESFAASCSIEEADALLKSFTASRKVDVAAPIRVLPTAGSDASASVSFAMTVITDVITNAPAPFFVTTNINAGEYVSFRFQQVNDPAKVQIEAAVRIEEFGGYKLPAPKIKTSYREEMDIPLPVFNLCVAATRAQIRTNEALLLGTGSRPRVMRSVERIPYLSDIPRLGEFFTKRNTFTNTIRTLVLIRPTAVPPVQVMERAQLQAAE